LIECKSGVEKVRRQDLFKKVRKYFRVAAYLRNTGERKAVKIVVIANVDDLDKAELINKAEAFGLDIQFVTPRQFYDENKESLKGTSRWLFGIGAYQNQA